MKASAVVLAAVALLSCGEARRSLPALGVVPDFNLTDESGKKFTGKSLNSVVWVADFIYTTCQGPCPRMSTQMRQLQEAVKDLPDVKLISITVDPEHDTPDALSAYGKRYKADPARWSFLTGPRETLQLLSKDGFHLGDVDGKLEHSSRFVLIDRTMRIRGYYATWEADALEKLLGDIRYLLKERV
jgi:protein SCO1